MVPATFTQEDTAKARQFILGHLSNCSIKGDRVVGNPLITYQELVTHIGYLIENESDGDRSGYLAGSVTEQEYALTGLMLSAVVVNASDSIPGKGFFTFAQHYGKISQKTIDVNGTEELTFWNSEIKKIVQKYGKSEPYFKPYHYNTFIDTKGHSDDPAIDRERGRVSEALRVLHDSLWEYFRNKGWDLHRHKMSQHYVSSDHLIPGIVSNLQSMWMHFGKSEEQLFENRALVNSSGPAQYDAFYCHTRIQVYIGDHDVRLWLIFTDNNFYDKDSFITGANADLRKNPAVREEFFKRINCIKDKGYFYVIDDEKMSLDEDNDSLYRFILKDRAGSYSGIVRFYNPDDPRINVNNIQDELKRGFEELYPLYQLMAYEVRNKVMRRLGNSGQTAGKSSGGSRPQAPSSIQQLAQNQGWRINGRII